MNIKAEYLIGKQKENEWSGVYGYRPEEGDSKSEMFVTVRIAVEKDEYSLENIAKILLDELQGSYFNPKKEFTDNIEKLEDSVWKMKSKMEYVLSREPSLSEEGLDIEMAISVVEENVVYLAVVGESKIFIKRGNKFVELSKGLVDANNMGFFKTGSIEIKEDDRICLGTSKSIEKGEFIIQETLEELNIAKLKDLEAITGAAFLILGDESLPWAIPQSEMPKEENAMVDQDLTEEMSDIEAQPVSKSLDHLVEEDTEDPDMIDQDEAEGMPIIANPTDENVYIEEAKGNKYLNKAKELGGKLKLKSAALVSQAASKVKSLRKSDSVESTHETFTIEDGEEQSEDKNYTSYVMDENEENTTIVKEDTRMSNIANKANLAKNSVVRTFQNKILPGLKRNNSTFMVILKNIGAKLKVVLDQLVGIFKEEIIGTNDRRDRVMRAKRRRRNRIILVIVVIVLLVLIYTGIKNADDSRQKQQRIDNATSQVANLKNKLSSLTPQILQAKNGPEDKKTQLLTELQKLTSDIALQKRDGLFVDDLDNLSKQVQSRQDDLLLVTAITDPKVVTDVGKNFPDAVLSDIAYSTGNLFISDSARGVVYKVSSTALNAQPQAYATGLSQPYLLVRNVDGDIVFYDNDATSTIGKFSAAGDPTVLRFPGLTPASVGKPIEAALYDGNNALYEVRQTSRQIFRRNQDGGGYIAGGAAPSTDPDTDWRDDPDFANALDISVPRDIWVLIKSQGVKRYLGGGDNTLTFDSYTNLLKADFDSMKNASSMDVADNNVVVSDPVGRRVLLFKYDDSDDAKLNFVKQYVYRGTDSTTFSDLDEVVVVQSESAIYVLDGTKVIKLDM
ncbi:MAG: hypothetical protein ACMG57_01850 [Candidatus Dojkabacteria bacterium]